VSGYLLLHYDEFHTPLGLVSPLLTGDGPRVVLHVRVDDADDGGAAPAEGWVREHVDARDEFAAGYLTRAVKANAVYEGGYYLSAALSRPLLAAVCARSLRERGIGVLVHGFAGNDQLRFEMAVQALAPETTIVSVASLLGSQNDRNGDGYTVSTNLWGRSVEAGPLADPATRPPAEVFERAGAGFATDVPAALHTVSFERGVPVAFDGVASGLPDLLRRVEAAARPHGFGYTDLVEDGAIALKTRAVYESPAAIVLVAAHRDLERLVATRAQNRFKALVDQAWAELVYDGYWFDAQRESLDAYVDSVNRWVTGDVDLLFRPGGVHVVGRRSPHGLYGEAESIYRFGQDFGAREATAVASSLSAHMRASVRRGATARENGNPRWNA
jgi:argininosuccinate synthase